MKRQIVIVFIALFFSCKQQTPIERFFDKLDNILSREEKNRIDSCRKIDCWVGFILSNKNEEFKKLSTHAITKEAIVTLDSTKYGKYRKFCLFIAYCKNRIGQKYDFPEILLELEEHDLNQRKLSDEFFTNKQIRLTKIADVNYKNIHVKIVL